MLFPVIEMSLTDVFQYILYLIKLWCQFANQAFLLVKYLDLVISWNIKARFCAKKTQLVIHAPNRVPYFLQTEVNRLKTEMVWMEIFHGF